MQSVSTKKADLSLTEEGHVLIRMRENQDFDMEDMLEINTMKNKLVNNSLHTVLMVAPLIGNLSTEAREFCISDTINRNSIAKAIVAKSLPARLITNFFIRVNKPPVPTKMFKTESEAKKWLNKIVKTAETVV